MKLNTAEEILTWFYGESEINKNSFLSDQITKTQYFQRQLNALKKAHDAILNPTLNPTKANQ